MPDALQLLRDDHKRVKHLFRQFEDTDGARAKGAIAQEALAELEVHAEIEEQIFYPAVRKEADPDDSQMDEAEEEHHVVKLLIAELRKMKPSAERYDAKFTVLAENVKHHIDEEESEMLPKAAELGADRMNELGAEMERRKLRLAAKAAAATGGASARRAVKRTSGRPATRTRTGSVSKGVRRGASRVAKRATRSRPAAAARSSAKTSSRPSPKRR